MKILLIGNGFDLAHGLPTSYKDFLDFIRRVGRIKDYNGDLSKFENTQLKDWEIHVDVKNYIVLIEKNMGIYLLDTVGITAACFMITGFLVVNDTPETVYALLQYVGIVN